MSNDLQILLGYKLSSSLFLHSKTVSTTGCIPPASWWVSVVQVDLFVCVCVCVFSFKLRTFKFGSLYFGDANKLVEVLYNFMLFSGSGL
jgi:hypothetical protein